jgi:hypothetical protein
MSLHGEFNIAREIKSIFEKDKDYIVTKEDMAEQIAFDFLEDYRNDNSGWGTYYGPMFVLPNDKGKMVEYPGIKGISKEVIEYWTQRSGEVKNPILSSRYADLAVDFSHKILGKTAEIELFRIVIDANITICSKSIVGSLDCKTKIKRALTLSIQKKDSGRIARTKDEILKLEKKIATDEHPGLWGFSFKWLVLDFGKDVLLSENVKNDLLTDLEDRLKRVAKNTWLTEGVVSLLAEYYASQKDEHNLMRVLDILENSLKADIRVDSDALLKVHAYEQIHEIYRKYSSHFSKSKESSKRLSREIGQLNLDWDKSLKEISVEIKIKQQDIDIFLKSIFGETEESGLETVIARLAVSLLPRKEVVKKQLQDISSKHPLQFLCTTQVISDDGIPIAKLSALEEDPDNHFKKYASQYVQLGSFLLSMTIDEIKRRFTMNQLIEYFDKAALFANDDKEYLSRAVSAYWDNDYLISSHLFIPLIESAVRELIKCCGGVILRPNEYDGYDRVLLHSLLKNDEIFDNVFSKSGHNVLFYFRLVLTEKLGMNLRNDFAHGFGKRKFFGRNASDRLFHILIWLSLVKKK